MPSIDVSGKKRRRKKNIYIYEKRANLAKNPLLDEQSQDLPMKKSGCELGILKKERKEYNPSQLTGRSKVEAPFPSQTPGFLPRCIRFRIVSWKQKAGSLCPAFKKLAKFSLKCLSFAQTLPSPSNFAPSLAPLLPFLNFLPPSSSPLSPFHLRISIFTNDEFSYFSLILRYPLYQSSLSNYPAAFISIVYPFLLIHVS